MITVKNVETVEERHQAYNIREVVFEDEMNIRVVDDFDGKDEEENTHHVLAFFEDRAVGTARWRPLQDGTVKVERVAVLPEFRKRGIGEAIMRFAEDTLRMVKFRMVTVNAQDYIKEFYEKLGYEQVGPFFKEAGILHVRMTKNL
ncbi:MAG: GNAT family N-acetyltransferase [Patescibacteria group bacterium]